MYIGPWQEFNAYNLFRDRQEKFNATKLQPLLESQFPSISPDKVNDRNKRDRRKTQTYSNTSNHSPSLRYKTIKRLPSLNRNKYVLNSAKPGSEPSYSTYISITNDEGNTSRDFLFSSFSDPPPRTTINEKTSFQQSMQGLSLPQQTSSTPVDEQHQQQQRNSHRHHNNISPRSARSNNSAKTTTTSSSSTLKTSARKSLTKKNSGIISIDGKVQKVQLTKALYMQQTKLDAGVKNDIPLTQVARETSSSSSSLLIKLIPTDVSSEDIDSNSSSCCCSNNNDISNTSTIIQDMALETLQLREISKYFQHINTAVPLKKSWSSSSFADTPSPSIQTFASATLNRRTVLEESKQLRPSPIARTSSTPMNDDYDDDDDEQQDDDIPSGNSTSDLFGHNQAYNHNVNTYVPDKFNNNTTRVKNNDGNNNYENNNNSITNSNITEPPWDNVEINEGISSYSSAAIKHNTLTTSSSGVYTGLFIHNNYNNSNCYHEGDDDGDINDNNGAGIDSLLNWSLSLQIP